MAGLRVIFCFLLVCVTYCAAQVVSSSTPRPENSEYEGFSFLYEHESKSMLVRMQQNCYIWTLTSDELAAIHTDNGMRQVEVRVIKEIDNALYTVIPENVINMNIVRYCKFGHPHSMTHYYLVH